MRRLKLKNAAPDAPDIPDSGSKRPTPIVYQMSKTNMQKLDINDVEIEFGDDPKATRSQVYDKRGPKSDYGLASEMIPDPDELEPSTRKAYRRQNIRPDVGSEPAQIKIRAANSKTKRKIMMPVSINLGDTTTHAIEAPKLTSTKVGRSTQHVGLGDTRDIGTTAVPVQSMKVKQKATSTFTHVEDTLDQSVEAPHNPLRVKKVTKPVSFAVSSGFQTDFNPTMPSHRLKLKKILDKYRVVIEQDPDVAVSIVSNLAFKGKERAQTAGVPDIRDTDKTEIADKPKNGHKKKVNTGNQRVETFDEVDVERRANPKTKTSAASRPLHVDNDERTEVEDSRHKTKSKRTTTSIKVEDTDATHVEIKDTRSKNKTKVRPEVQMDVPEDGKFIPLGGLKSNSRGKKTRGKFAVNVAPYEGEVVLTAKPPELSQKKGKSDTTGLEPSETGVEVQVETRRVKSKKVKKPENLDLELSPADKDADEEIDEPVAKERGRKAELPQLDPSRDDQDVEIEKPKNVLVFT